MTRLKVNVRFAAKNLRMPRLVVVTLLIVAFGAAPSPFAQLHFRNLGPQVSGGRLGAVAGSDRDPSLYYAGAAGGGVWKTTNAGQSWTPVFDGQDVSSIGAIAIDPRDTNVVWVGTGEAAPRNDVSTGDGVYRSGDGGKTWQHVLALKHALVSRILIDPRANGTVLVGVLGDPFGDSTDRGAYRTADDGKTWSKTLYVDARTGISDMAAAAKAPGVVYAGMWTYRRTEWSSDSGGPQGGLYRSADFGATWQRLSGHGLPDGPTGRIGVAIAPSDPQRVYALIESKSGLLWRSGDGGASWKMISDNTLIDERPFYYTHVFVDPTRENHLWTLSVHVAQSMDGGATWKIGARGVHGDNHDMWISSDASRIIEANDGGPSFSFDDGATWAMPHNLPIAQLYHVGVDARVPYHLCAPLQDNGVWCASNDPRSGRGITSSNWHSIGGGDGTWAVPDPADPRIVWFTSGGGTVQGSLSWLDTRTGETHIVQPYMHDQNVYAPKALAYRFNWETPIAFDPFDPHRIYEGGNVLFTSTDRGAKWKAISPDLTRNISSHEEMSGGITLDVTGAETSDTILYIEPSRARRGELWIGTDDGYVQLTRDGGRTWQNVTPASVRASGLGRFASLSAPRTAVGTVYAAYDLHMLGDRTPHLFRTRDFGVHWTDLAGSFPRDQQVRSVRVDPRNPSVVYAGLERSLWVSFDAGASWRRIPNLPPVSIRDIRVAPRGNDLVLATHGRAVYVLDDAGPLQQWDDRPQARVFAIRPAVQWNLHGYWATHRDGSEPPYGAIVTYYLPAAANVRAEIVDASGRTVRHFVPIKAVRGFNRFVWDTTRDKPADWNFTPDWNRGFDAGAPVVPGRYTAVIHDGARTLRESFEVRQDFRTHYTAGQLREGAEQTEMLMRDFDRIDRALNVVSTVLNEAPLRVKALNAAGNGALALRVSDVATQARTLLLSITQNPMNDQDDDFLTDLLRERLQFEIDYTQSTFGPPPQGIRRENASLNALTADRLRAFQAFRAGPLAQIDAALRAAKQQPLTTLTVNPEVYSEDE